MSSKADVLDGHLTEIRWQERITNKEVLKMAEMKMAENLSEDVRRRRWKFIGHIMRKEPNNDRRTALTWAPEGRRKRGRPRTTWRRTVEGKWKKRDGRTGVRYKWLRLTEMVGRIVLRPYVPHGTKKICNSNR